MRPSPSWPSRSWVQWNEAPAAASLLAWAGNGSIIHSLQTHTQPALTLISNVIKQAFNAIGSDSSGFGGQNSTGVIHALMLWNAIYCEMRSNNGWISATKRELWSLHNPLVKIGGAIQHHSLLSQTTKPANLTCFTAATHLLDISTGHKGDCVHLCVHMWK